jgi:hypothetical protein
LSLLITWRMSAHPTQSTALLRSEGKMRIALSNPTAQ